MRGGERRVNAVAVWSMASLSDLTYVRTAHAACWYSIDADPVAGTEPEARA